MHRKICILKYLKFFIFYQFVFIIRVESLTYNLKGKHGEGYLIDVSIGEPTQDASYTFIISEYMNN